MTILTLRNVSKAFGGLDNGSEQIVAVNDEPVSCFPLLDRRAAASRRCSELSRVDTRSEGRAQREQ